MAKSLKSKGVQELTVVRSRVLRQRALGRISKRDADFLEGHIDAALHRIQTMEENEDG